VREQRSLFRPDQLERLNRARRLAVEAMHQLAAFGPRLFGALSDGAGPVDRIELWLDADTSEPVIFALQEQGIPWHPTERTWTHGGGRRLTHEALSFEAGDLGVLLVIGGSRADPPLDPVDGRPMALLGATELESLL
jgi:hypothetical protein